MKDNWEDLANLCSTLKKLKTDFDQACSLDREGKLRLSRDILAG